MNNKARLEKTPFVIHLREDGGGADANELAEHLGAEVAAQFGPREEAPLSVFAHDETGALVGGLNGVTHWRWLYVRHLWVAPPMRGRGLATRLLADAEAQARARGAIGVYIDTFNPRAAAMYEKRGFTQFGAIEDFPSGAQRYFLCRKFT
ncbi:MAG: GNAT family N-acetyltransferase [Hyphomicrobiales bacterium]|nr:GNAT family N-acetyltransferase [Hyphomicrobiales bacterium]